MSLVLALPDWPEDDRMMWDALQRQGNPLDDQGALAHLRATSLRTLELRYGRWLRWLIDRNPDAIALPAFERASPASLRAWLADLAHTRPMSQLMFVDAVLRVLSAAAPDHDWQAQLRLKARLKQVAGRGDRSRKQGRVLSSALLLDTGLEHAGRGAETATTVLEAMKRRRDGTMIALLALMPMRRRSFAALCLGESVHVSDDEIIISLSSDMTKTSVPWEAAVPPQVAPVLRRYLSEVRPWFMARRSEHHAFLWVDKFGQPLEENYLGVRIATVTLQLTGVRVPPHLFRDAAATTLARISPRAATLIRPVLAHSGFGTAEHHYIHATSIDAGRDYLEVIQRLKKGMR